MSVCCYFNDDGLLGVFASVVRGILWPARVVNIGLNKTLDWDLGARIDAFGARVEAMCTRGRAFGKAANVDEDDESDDDARSEEPAPGGSERSGLTSFEESPKEPTGTLLADYWWLYALVAAAVFYWHVPPSFALWPPLASTWGCAVGLSHWPASCWRRSFCGVSTVSARFSFAGPYTPPPCAASRTCRTSSAGRWRRPG